MGSHVGCTADWADYPDVGALTRVRINDEKGVGFRVDAPDDLLAGPLPSDAGIPEMRDVFVRALRVRFGDAGHLRVGHCCFLPGAIPGWPCAPLYHNQRF